jgi:glutamyl-tRNA reductase
MSPVGRALHQQFETVCRSELQRLRRKTAALTEEDRAQVDALTLEVARRLAAHLDAALEKAGPAGAGLTPLVMRLFAVTPAERATGSE